MGRKAWVRALAAGIPLVLLALGGCSHKGSAGKVPTRTRTAGYRGARITVGSKNFTEEFILGEMYALMLENGGFQVGRKLNLGCTPVAQAAILSHQIDLYPEYTRTALLTVLKLPASGDPQRVYDEVAREYRKRYHLIWLEQSPMNNTEALAMTREGAGKYGISTISQMVAMAGRLTLIGPPEFAEREDGLPGLKRVYGNIHLKRFLAVDPGLRYQGLLKGDADVVVAFGTDGEIAAYHLVVQEDDKHLFPPYHVAPVVRQDTLDSHPQIREILNRLAPRITTEQMQKLNYEVSGRHREPAAVAKEFLAQQGLIRGAP